MSDEQRDAFDAMAKAGAEFLVRDDLKKWEENERQELKRVMSDAYDAMVKAGAEFREARQMLEGENATEIAERPEARGRYRVEGENAGESGFEGATGAPGVDSILLEAEHIVTGNRQDAYGNPLQSFEKAAAIASLVLGRKVDAEMCIVVLMAVKLARESYQHQRDNLVDLCGYAEFLNRARESG